MKDALSQEIYNRYRARTPDQRRDPVSELVRITVEVTREFMQNHPDGVDEFLRLYGPRSFH